MVIAKWGRVNGKYWIRNYRVELKAAKHRWTHNENGAHMDIFQQWLLLRIQERFGVGANPMDNEIPFDAIASLIKPIFEEEGALLDEDELRRNLDALVTLGYLTLKSEAYFLTFRAMVYSQASSTISQLVKEELGQYFSRNWWKMAGVAFLLVTLMSALMSIVAVSVMAK